MLSKLNFITILLIAFVDYLGIGLVYPVFAALLFDPKDPMIAESASLAYRGAMLGILIGLTPLTQFFSSPILGKLSDFKGRKTVLIYGTAIGCLGYCLAIVGIGLHSLALLFLYRIFVGIAEGTIAVAQAMIADISTEENKARRFALFNASLGTGFTIGPFLGGKLADPSVASWCSYAMPFSVAGILCLINFFLILWKFPETRQIHGKLSFNVLESMINIRKIFLWEKLRWLFFAAFAFSFGWSFFNEFIPLLLHARFAFAPSEIGNYYAYGGAWYALSAGIMTAPLLKYFTPEKVVIKALIGCAACMLLYLVVREAQSIWWILPPFMYCLSATYPTTGALVSNQANGENQGEVLGAYQSVIASAMGLSPLLVGSFVGVYPELTAWGGAIAMLLASGTLWWNNRSPSLARLNIIKE
jgi:DHA1 family tetracycline resistance protein-like MFS transporter